MKDKASLTVASSKHFPSQNQNAKELQKKNSLALHGNLTSIPINTLDSTQGHLEACLGEACDLCFLVLQGPSQISISECAQQPVVPVHYQDTAAALGRKLTQHLQVPCNLHACLEADEKDMLALKLEKMKPVKQQTHNHRICVCMMQFSPEELLKDHNVRQDAVL